MSITMKNFSSVSPVVQKLDGACKIAPPWMWPDQSLLNKRFWWTPLLALINICKWQETFRQLCKRLYEKISSNIWWACIQLDVRIETLAQPKWAQFIVLDDFRTSIIKYFGLFKILNILFSKLNCPTVFGVFLTTYIHIVFYSLI